MKQLQDLLLQALQADVFNGRNDELGGEVIPKPAGAADFAKFMRESLDKHGAIVTALKIGKYEQ